MTNKPTGYLLHETDTYAVIATLESENRKTGDMIQVWILPRRESPVDAVRTSHDAIVCGDCPHRGIGFKSRTCYVNVVQGPHSVWRKYRDDKYPMLAIAEYSRVFAGRAVRFGAYGEPVLIPMAIVRAIVAHADGHTGYTHQWRKPEYATYREYVMASCDSMADHIAAKALGWRTFRVRTSDAPLVAREISCPASDEAGKRTQCVRCRLCNGAGSSDARKDIAIIVHGSGSKNFVGLDSIR
jgi:hypothetical protein